MGRKYRFLVFGGLIAIGAVMYGAGALSDDTSGKTTSFAFIAAVALFTVAIATSQLRSAKRSLGDDSKGGLEEARLLDDAGRVSDVPEMFQLLALREFDPGALRRLRRLTLSNSRIAIGLMLVLTAVPLTVIGLGAADALPDIAPIWAQAGLATIVVGGGVVFAWMWWRLSGAAIDALGPLGLAEIVTGDDEETVFGGERHGRQVRIGLRAGEWTTQVDAAVRPFELRESRGRLRVADEAPAEVRTLVERIRPGESWRGLRKVEGGPSGVVASREPGSGHGNGWLWDLWLAERLASELAT